VDIDTLLNDHQMYHSDLQMDGFITAGNGGTEYGMYKHALRELYKRTRGLRELYIAKERTLIDIEEKEAKKTEGFASRRKRLDLLELNGRLEETIRNIRDTEREYQRFYSQAYSLKQRLGELTTERRKQLDCEMWVYNLKSKMALQLLCGGRISPDTIELVHALPLTQKREALAVLNDPETLKIWYENRQVSFDFKPQQLDFRQVEKELSYDGN